MELALLLVIVGVAAAIVGVITGGLAAKSIADKKKYQRNRDQMLADIKDGQKERYAAPSPQKQQPYYDQGQPAAFGNQQQQEPPQQGLGSPYQQQRQYQQPPPAEPRYDGTNGYSPELTRQLEGTMSKERRDSVGPMANGPPAEQGKPFSLDKVGVKELEPYSMEKEPEFLASRKLQAFGLLEEQRKMGRRDFEKVSGPQLTPFDKKLRRTLDNTMKDKEGRHHCLVELLYPGEPLGINFAARDDNHVEIREIVDGKAADRNGLPKGWITGIGDYHCKCLDDMKTLLDALRLEGITEFFMEISDKYPTDEETQQYEEEGGLLPVPQEGGVDLVEDMAIQWVKEQEELHTLSHPGGSAAQPSLRSLTQLRVGNAANTALFNNASYAAQQASPRQQLYDAHITHAQEEIVRAQSGSPQRFVRDPVSSGRPTTTPPSGEIRPASMRRLHGAQVRED